jgi:hypothetical protein
MVWMVLLCGLGMVGGGAYLMLHESVALGALAVLGGLGLLAFGAWVSSRERAHRHTAADRGPSPS